MPSAELAQAIRDYSLQPEKIAAIAMISAWDRGFLCWYQKQIASEKTPTEPEHPTTRTGPQRKEEPKSPQKKQRRERIFELQSAEDGVRRFSNGDTCWSIFPNGEERGTLGKQFFPEARISKSKQIIRLIFRLAHQGLLYNALVAKVTKELKVPKGGVKNVLNWMGYPNRSAIKTQGN